MRCLRLLALLAIFTGCDAAKPARERKFTAIDLQAQANQTLADPFYNSKFENSLRELPRGEQVLEEIKFNVGDGLVLATSRVAGALVLSQAGIPLETIKKTDIATLGWTEKVEGIPVHRKATLLHFLHSTAFGHLIQKAWQEPDGARIGEYTIHYSDSTTVAIPIIYGEDVRDWWNSDRNQPVTRGTVAWRGENGYTRKLGSSLRLFVMSWENPFPEKEIVSIDLTAGKTSCAPFCVAITAEEP